MGPCVEGRPVSTDRSAPQWGNKDARLAARLHYAAELNVKVDIRKVNLEVGPPDLLSVWATLYLFSQCTPREHLLYSTQSTTGPRNVGCTR